MRQALHELEVKTSGPGAYGLTREITGWVSAQNIQSGLLTAHVRHTSASLLIQENADPEVMRDMERFLRRLVPPGDDIFRHSAEGPDDMPAHVRAALTSTTLSIPVVDGTPALGTWQGIFLYEHRDAPHRRRVALHLIGE